MKRDWIWNLRALSVGVLCFQQSSAQAASDADKRVENSRPRIAETSPRDAADRHRGRSAREADNPSRKGEHPAVSQTGIPEGGSDRHSQSPATSGSSKVDAPGAGIGTRGGLSDQSDLGKSSERRSDRLARIRELKNRWGGRTLMQPNVRDELRHHAWRVARLKRMRELALEKKNDKLVAKIDQLEQKENARHERAMARQQAAAAGSSALPIPDATVGSVHPGGTSHPKSDPPASSAHGERGGRP
ncbi:MAG: hypothetical protein QM784_00750 [Polyangiaceae bacterium]